MTGKASTGSPKNPLETESDPATAATGMTSPAGSMDDMTRELWGDVGNETMQFIASRVQQFSETRQAMLACTNLMDIQKVQADFYKESLEAYSAQATRMMKAMSAVSPKGLYGVPLMTSRDYDDIPL